MKNILVTLCAIAFVSCEKETSFERSCIVIDKKTTVEFQGEMKFVFEAEGVGQSKKKISVDSTTYNNYNVGQTYCQ